MHDGEKSDRPVLPVKLPNNPAAAEAEVVEGRGLPEGNTASETRPAAVPDRAADRQPRCAMATGTPDPSPLAQPVAISSRS